MTTKKAGLILFSFLFVLLVAACSQPPAQNTTTALLDPLKLKECGRIGDKQVECQAGELCADAEVLSSTAGNRCYPQNICSKNICPKGTRCAIVQDWPAKVICQLSEKE